MLIFNAPSSVSCFAHTPFIVTNFLSMPTCRATLISFLFHTAPSVSQFLFLRLVVLLCPAFLRISYLSFSCNLLIPVSSFLPYLCFLHRLSVSLRIALWHWTRQFEPPHMREYKPNNAMRQQGVVPVNAVLAELEKWFTRCKGFMDRLLRRQHRTLVCNTPTCKNTTELQVCTLLLKVFEVFSVAVT